MSTSFLSVLVLALISSCLAVDPVPLLAWSNSDSLSEVKTQLDLKDILSQIKLDEIKVAVILKADDLSFDDLAMYGGVYGETNAPLGGLQTLVSQSASSLSAGLSGQQPASQLVTSLSFAMDNEPVYSNGASDWPELKSQQVIVVRMPQGRDENTFRQHDSIVRAAVARLAQSNLPYAVFYTGDHSSGYDYQSHDIHLTRRSIDGASIQLDNDGLEDQLCVTFEDTSNNNCTQQNSTCPVCLLLCLDTRVTHTAPAGNVSVTALANGTNSFTKMDGSCSTTTGTGKFSNPYSDGRTFAFAAFNVQFNTDNDNVTRSYNKTMMFTFVRGDCQRDPEDNSTRILCGFWTMHLFAGDNPDSLSPHDQFHSEKIFSRFVVPLTTSNGTTKVSYACGNSSLNRFVGTGTNNSEIISSFQLTGIQVQPFTSLKEANGKLFFNTAFNCQGYLGSVSFMGLVSLIILLIIIYISSVFIFSIVSIDRFDDPRGTPLKVENLH